MAKDAGIRIHVEWKEGSVFAGEEIECILRFKNTQGDGSEATTDEVNNTTRAKPTARQRALTHSTQQLSTAASVAGSRAPSRGHRPALSLSLAPAPLNNTNHGRTASQVSVPNTATTSARRPLKHGRSLSILSLSSDKAMAAPATGRGGAPPRGHGRSASMQIMSRTPSHQGPAVMSSSYRQQTSPLYDAHPHVDRRGSGVRTVPNTPVFNFPSPTLNQPTSATSSNFAPSSRYPPSTCMPPPPPRQASATVSFPPPTPPTFSYPPPTPPTFSIPPHSPAIPPSNKRSPNLDRSPIHDFEFPIRSPGPPPRSTNPRSSKPLPDAVGGHANPVARILSESSANDTPRSSSDFYSMTNHSSETMSSDTAPPPTGRLLPKPRNARKPSPPTSAPKESGTETLMMGYAQTMGSFVLDGSLVNQAPFEHVKRKGVVGGQGGGGVVGVERSKRESGLFGFGWGNIGESLGGLLGGGEMSSIKEMRGLASSKSIPLLSTPQSILFVDLRLGPGESKSYSYRFRLPRGLPPTHKGRAIKVQYHLTLGVQRPGKQQEVKHIDIPFRVLGSVDNQGETLGHDLMSPYIILDDRARSTSVALTTPTIRFPPDASSSDQKPSSALLQDFLNFTDSLLPQPTPSSNSLLSPLTTTKPASSSRRRSSVEDLSPRNAKEAIDLAILRSNLSSTSSSSSQPAQSNNRFTIARAGQSVAVITILRPSFRLGETIHGQIDFTPPSPDPNNDGIETATQIPSYNITISLETVESVDPSLAMRSSSSISRATRKLHSSISETVLFARKLPFRLDIPLTATPTFETTGVTLGWRVKVEFVTSRVKGQGSALRDEVMGVRGLGIEDAEEREQSMLEEVGRDERGVVRVARERLLAEMFEVAVPIKVFGVGGGGTGEAEGVRGEGLEI